MADEIDIEEHDVMDNPTIRRIFPDLSIIKKEISKYYEEGPDTKPEPVSGPVISLTEFATEPPCDTKDFATQSDHPDIPEDSGRYIQNNVIILGSKPNKLCTEKQSLETIIQCVPKIKLQNISLHLNKSKAYCRDCMVLFPKICDLESHKKLVHDHRKKTFTYKRKGVNKSMGDRKHKCNICIGVLSSRSNLIRHLKNIHHFTHTSNKTVENVERSDDESTMESMDSEYSSNIPKTDANCFHCHKVFPTQKALVDHLYDILEPKKIDCQKCTMKFSSQENLEKHVTSIHNEKSASDSFECHKCAIQILSKKILDQHDQDKHRTIRPKGIETHNAKHNLHVNYDLANEELSEEDEPVTLPKRIKRNVIKHSESFAETAVQKLRQKNDIKASNNISENVKGTCDKEFHFEKMLKQHNLSTSKKEDYLKKESEVKLSTNKNDNNSSDKKILVGKAYQCYICSHYVIKFSNYVKHMVSNHKMKKIPKVKKVLFDSECKFCLSKLHTIKSYNFHIVRSHNEKKTLDGRNGKLGIRRLYTKTAVSKNGDHEITSFAFKSVLYKCIKCDICFLTAKTAMNHSEHMEVLINWKCGICNRIFKGIDKCLHVKQHSNSHSFTVYNICDSDWNLVLYMCLKCTIYFSEDSYVNHYSTCGKQTPDSVYCKVCDGLISRVDFDSHEQIHAKNKHISATDFTIIETDLITEDVSSNCVKRKNDKLCSAETTIKKMIHDKTRFYLTYCGTCQCVMSFVAKGDKTDAHRKALCMHLKKHTCKHCGIIFTVRTYKSHRKLHQEVKDLNIQNFFFFDHSDQPIRPPLPTYPSCNICGVHFLSRTDVIEHECNGYDYMRCHVCQLKLSEVAFKYHMQFHEYSMERSKDITATAKVTSKGNNAMLNETTTLDSLNQQEMVELELLYSCKICKITFDVYDLVIQHCQRHYDRRKAPVAKQSCQYCALNFDESYYKIHEKMHSRTNYNVQSMKMINFDPFYFCLDNNFWLKHIFKSLSVNQIEKILRHSIYRFECRLKMEIFQFGPSNNTLYECEKCLTYVDPRSLYVHAENPQCTNMRKYPCSACGLRFNTAKCKMDHEKLHEHTDISLNSHRIVKTNNKNDQIFHKMMFKSRCKFIMYQCRNCLVSVDKPQRHIHRCVFHNIVKCSHCGLLFCKQEYNTHTNRHKELEQFNTNHISVVFFGKKLYKGNQLLAPSFNGKTYDYTFYKCTTCELCIRTKDSTSKHKCVFDDTKSKCPKCDLYFLKQELASHALLHEIDPEFEDNNLNIIIFDSQPNVKHLKRIVGNKENSSQQNADSTIKNQNENEAHNNNMATENAVKLFKCDCGLHFIDETNARKHYNNCNPNMKISKQHCSKCELLFTPGELFTHLLSHHGDKKHEYTFDISFIYKDDEKSPLFKCIKCNLHFVHESEVNSHFDECNESGIGGEKCKKCGLRFKMSSLYRNKHKSVCEKKYEIKVISEVKDNEPPSKERIDDVSGFTDIDNIVTKKDMVLAREYSLAKDYLSKIDLSKYNNVIYKCDVCNVYYITENTWRRHIHFLSVYDACSVCGLNFSLQSLARHNYIHHEKFNLKKDEFIIKNNNL